MTLATMIMVGNICIVLLAIILISLCWPVVYLIADLIEKSARFAVRVLRAHADALGEYADAFRRHYERRAAQ